MRAEPQGVSVPSSRDADWTSSCAETRNGGRKHERTRPKDQQTFNGQLKRPPPWHSRRLPSRLARSAKLEGDSKTRVKGRGGGKTTVCE